MDLGSVVVLDCGGGGGSRFGSGGFGFGFVGGNLGLLVVDLG